MPRSHKGSVGRVDGQIEIVDSDGHGRFKLSGLRQAGFRLGAGRDRTVAGPMLGAPIMLVARAALALLGESMA